VARTPADRSTSQPSLREHLAQVPAWLKPEAPAHIAQAVSAVLAPGGWEQLRATDPAREEGSKNLAMNLPLSIRDAIKAAHEEQAAAAKKAGRDEVSLTAKVNEGLVAFLEGRFVPVQRPLRKAAQPEARRNLNVTASALLQRQAAEKAQQIASDPRRGAAWVASEWLMHEYGLGPYAQDLRPVLEKGGQRNFQMPTRIRDLVRSLSAASGDSADDIINEGYQAFLDGRFDPQPVVWQEADQADMGLLKVHPNNALFEQVQAACKGRPGLGSLYGPSRVAIDYLLDQLGIDPEAPADTTAG